MQAKSNFAKIEETVGLTTEEVIKRIKEDYKLMKSLKVNDELTLDGNISIRITKYYRGDNFISQAQEEYIKSINNIHYSKDSTVKALNKYNACALIRISKTYTDQQFYFYK